MNLENIAISHKLNLLQLSLNMGRLGWAAPAGLQSCPAWGRGGGGGERERRYQRLIGQGTLSKRSRSATQWTACRTWQRSVT